LEQRARYVRGHRDDQHGMKVVRKLLGARFVDEVLFPAWLAPVTLVSTALAARSVLAPSYPKRVTSLDARWQTRIGWLIDQ
ncbi:hypothetical protein, partial [Streptomyces sp. P17]|uniref:hypothetical protein n=1 Tax=Streptomyces sp. P17 TaxID=3074716 RepID=UPI0028F40DED